MNIPFCFLVGLIITIRNVFCQPRSQSSSAISDVTSPVKLVGKIRLGRLANNGKSKMAALSQDS